MTDPEHDSSPTQHLGSISRLARRLYAIPAEKACSCPFTEDMPIPSEASEKGAFLPAAANLLIEKEARDGCNVVMHIILIEREISTHCSDGVTIITPDVTCIRWPKVMRRPGYLRFYPSKWNMSRRTRESLSGPCNVIIKHSADKFAMSLYSLIHVPCV
jgi:hypothetical protein